jgi:hypothetical protein
LFEIVAQVSKEETPEQVRGRKKRPSLLNSPKNRKQDSPDDAELPGAILQLQASVSSLPISCGDSSEHEGHDSGKMLFSFLDELLSF